VIVDKKLFGAIKCRGLLAVFYKINRPENNPNVGYSLYFPTHLALLFQCDLSTYLQADSTTHNLCSNLYSLCSPAFVIFIYLNIPAYGIPFTICLAVVKKKYLTQAIQKSLSTHSDIEWSVCKNYLMPHKIVPPGQIQLSQVVMQLVCKLTITVFLYQLSDSR
jgi:hypothetical protein